MLYLTALYSGAFLNLCHLDVCKWERQKNWKQLSTNIFQYKKHKVIKHLCNEGRIFYGLTINLMVQITSVHWNSKLNGELKNSKLPQASYSALCSKKFSYQYISHNIYANVDISVFANICRSYCLGFTFIYDLSNKHVTEFTNFQQYHQILNIIGFVRRGVVAGLLYWTALHCLGVSNKGDTSQS